MTLDLRTHEALVEHCDGRTERIALTPNRFVADVTLDLLAAVRELAGPVEITMTPRETAWTTPLDEDTEHATYEPQHVTRYFEMATRAAFVLADMRAPYRGRSTPVNAWWGSFDLALNIFSGLPAEPPSDAFEMRNGMDAQELAVGWWPGDARYPRAAFYAYAHPAPDSLADADLAPGRWDAQLGEFLLDWDDVFGADDPHATALGLARSFAQHGCLACGRSPELTASLAGNPPPVR